MDERILYGQKNIIRMKEYYTKDDGTYPKEYCIPAEILAQRCLLPVTNCLEEDKRRFYLCAKTFFSQKSTWKLILIRLASASTSEKEAMLVIARDWAAASQMSTSTKRWTTVREPKWTWKSSYRGQWSWMTLVYPLEVKESPSPYWNKDVLGFLYHMIIW